MKTGNWMRALANRFDRARQKYPEEPLMIVFDIDGTILDMRYMARWVLLAYDRAHGTSYFHGLSFEDIRVHENQLDRFLEEWPLPESKRENVLQWYLDQRWNRDSILASHQPYRGVMDVIRWFQIQPGMHVGLNTGRPESIREATLRSLNALGEGYRVRFESELLYMNPQEWDEDVPAAKAAGVLYFQQKGYRVLAAVDNEPENIKAMAEVDSHGEILFLHASTLFETKRSRTPRTVRGKSYDITSLMAEKDLPRRIQFAWHGVNDRANLRQFLASPIHWGECDIRVDPIDRLVLRHDSFEQTPWSEAEEVFTLEECLQEFKRLDKAVKLDLKEGRSIPRVLALIERIGFEDTQLWFNGNIEFLQKDDFRELAARYPRAIRQSPVNFLAPLILSMPSTAQEILHTMTEWGINRLSVSWQKEKKRQIVAWLEEQGYEVNIYDVPNLEAFLQAALIMPRSLTSDFNFPKWFYFGHGSGQSRDYFRYKLEGTRH